MKLFAIYFSLFLIYSFLGWCMEVLLSLYKEHKFINRGFLIGPYCPIYGFGCVLIIVLLRKYTDDIVTLFFMSILICSLLEYLTSFFMEKLFNARWWDYSDKKFNINGRICLETMIPFGILGTFIMYVINPFIVGGLEKININVLFVISIILFIIFLTDWIISIFAINSFKHEITAQQKDQTELITKHIKNILMNKGYLTKRLLRAFPQVKTSKEVLLDLQKKIEKSLKLEKKKG